MQQINFNAIHLSLFMNLNFYVLDEITLLFFIFTENNYI
jgi:hypothetical protein